MMKNLLFFLLLTTALALTNQVRAAIFMIGDNDGYGVGIPDGGRHAFETSVSPADFVPFDGRSAEEKLATNGAQFTDTYSTAHPGISSIHPAGFSPSDQLGSDQKNTVAKFTFSGLGNSWTSGVLEADLADIQAKQNPNSPAGFKPLTVEYNGILQNWGFDDFSPNTVIHKFDLSQAVIDSINSTGSLIVTIDRKDSQDFYGVDYLKLSDVPAAVPIPAAFWLFGSAMVAMGSFVRRKQVPSA